MTGDELRPLLPDWLKNRDDLTSTVGGFSRRNAHRAVWHAIRLPLYALRLAWRSPVGLWRILQSLYYLLADGVALAACQSAIARNDEQLWLRLRDELRDSRAKRTRIAAILAVPLLAIAVVAYFMAPAWILWCAISAVVLVLGYVGRPVGEQFIPTAITPCDAPGPLRAPIVLAALTSLGISRMSEKNIEDIRLLSDVTRDGPGYRCDLELPLGVPATSVIDKRSELSAAVRRELGTVWPERGVRHEGHLVLYVCDQNMNTAKQPLWPLHRTLDANIFKPAPAFTDQRSNWVPITLAYTSGVIGAMPRMGKTFVLREILLIAGMDVRTKVLAFDLKGTGDLSPIALYAHAYSVGDEPDEIDEQLRIMRWVREEMRRRARVLRGLSHEECPENKVTDALANRKDLGLEPIFIGVDECQAWFTYEDKAIAAEFIAICTDLAKRGPALGVALYLATQKPDAKSIPTAIASNASVRICLKVDGQQGNDQVLGTSSYKNGLRATMFSFDDKGIAYLRGDGADARIVRSVVGLDAVAAEKIAIRIRAEREAEGRLTGQAIGEEMQRETEDVKLLDDVRQVVGITDAMHLTDMVTGLAALRPELYGSLDPTSLATQLRGAGVTVDQVYVADKPRPESSRKGVKREWLDVSTTAVLGDSQREWEIAG